MAAPMLHLHDRQIGSIVHSNCILEVGRVKVGRGRAVAGRAEGHLQREGRSFGAHR